MMLTVLYEIDWCKILVHSCSPEDFLKTFFSQMSQQLMDRAPLNLVHTFMFPVG